MKRFYVTMTWDDWPEGGSYGAIVYAKDHAEAKDLCKDEMVATRVAGTPDDELEAETARINNYRDEWETVDCFELDPFIKEHMQ